MKALFFIPTYPAPLPFWIGPEITAAAVEVQLNLERGDVYQQLRGGCDETSYSIFSLLGTVDHNMPNPTAVAEALRLTGQTHNLTGAVLFAYNDESYPVEPKKPLFSFKTQEGRDYFAHWAKLIAGSLAIDAPYKAATHYWDFLCDGEVTEDAGIFGHEPEDSIVVLLNKIEDFRELFCIAAQPAIDYIFSSGLRSAEAELAYDEDEA